VLKSDYGYHLIKVIERKPARQLPFEKAKDKILAILMADREQAEYSSWLEEQVRHATVKRDDHAIASISVETIGED
jgi:foldase protein PrsA